MRVLHHEVLRRACIECRLGTWMGPNSLELPDFPALGQADRHFLVESIPPGLYKSKASVASVSR